MVHGRSEKREDCTGDRADEGVDSDRGVAAEAVAGDDEVHGLPELLEMVSMSM